MGQNQSKTESFECCVGETINLTCTYSGYMYSIQWKFNGKTILSNKNKYTKNGAEYADIGKYECKINGKVECVFHVNVYNYLFEDDFLGIRMSVTDSHSSTGNLKTQDSSLWPWPTFPKNKWIEKARSASMIEEEEARSASTAPKILFKDTTLTVFSMERNPRGIAVIIGIEKFDTLNDLPGIQKDIENCETTFSQLHFDVKVCNSTKVGDILAYLKKIANKNHADYDCFILYISSHGGHGFVCGSDYDKTYEGKARGYIYIDTLIEMFISKKCKTLKDKPKLFFFDCCRNIGSDISENKHGSPIRPFKNAKELAKHYADILIGYATITGTSTGIDTNGSDYTNVLTTCINDLAPTHSFGDVMTEVATQMRQKHNQIAHHESTLGGQITMRKLV